MGILFAKSATKSQKVGLSLMLLVVLMSMLGICHGALVNELIIKYGAVVALLLSLVCTPLTVRTVLRNQHLKLSRKPGKRLLIVIGYSFFVTVFLYSAIARGIPILCHYFVSSRGEIIVTVERRESRYKTKSCLRGGITVREYSNFLNSDLCGFERADWERLKPGSQLILEGQRSIFAFTFSRYRLAGESDK